MATYAFDASVCIIFSNLGDYGRKKERNDR
jgi:hypothetical protein